MTNPFVVVGGDAAGMSAASKARRENPDRDIVVFEKGEWVSYGACGLPYYVKGDIAELEDLVSVTPTEFREDRNIDVRTNHEIVAIDPVAKSVTVAGPDETFEQGYGDLLIATGASAVVPPIEGIELPDIYTLHDMEDGKSVKERITTSESAQRAGIVGGGYVGVEMAEALMGQGVDVHLFEMLPWPVAPFGDAVGKAVAKELREQGVRVSLNSQVAGFEGEDSVTGIQTSEESVPVDFVLVGAGVKPNVTLADEAGIEIGPTGAIATDEYGRTSAENVYAAGDCAEANHAVTGEPAHVPLALTANRAGRAIGQTVAGKPKPVGSIVGTAAVKAFDLEAARTGLLDEKRAKEAGFEPVSKTISSRSRADYYPNGKEITVTLVADKSSKRLLGGSLVGQEGVPKRIDTIATALHNSMTVPEFEQLDLSYAPPFGPTWDPVLTAAKVIAGSMD